MGGAVLGDVVWYLEPAWVVVGWLVGLVVLSIFMQAAVYSGTLKALRRHQADQRWLEQHPGRPLREGIVIPLWVSLLVFAVAGGVVWFLVARA